MISDSIPTFISELIRAAHEIAQVTLQERGAMLRRAAITIRQLDGELGELGNGASVTDLIESSMLPLVMHDDDARRSMLHAAEMIRLLHMAERARRGIPDEADDGRIGLDE